VLTADYFENVVLINEGSWKFTLKPLPWLAQLAPYRDAVVVNVNNDNLPDILFAGNFDHNNIQMGKYNSDIGTLLINNGNGAFSCDNLNGLTVRGEVRHIRKLNSGEKELIILAKNNDSTKVIRFH
jgi:enediyne biosynthesis protein E4